VDTRGSVVEDIAWRVVLTEIVFRLFLSSPGDVAAERARAEAVVEKLNAEFKDRARFDPVFWEDHFYSADKTFEDQIPEAADCDLVLAVFKARLGSPLPEDFKRQPNGEPYPSGSAYEVLSAIAKRHSGATQPDIYVFRYPNGPQVDLEDTKFDEIKKQWNALKDFFARWFKTPSGEFVAGFHPYDSPDDFAERVEKCMREWLAKRGIVAREIWDRTRFGSPFPGLEAFDANREHVFFGRGRAIRQASERVRAAKTPFLLILGASGAGKSSLLRGGLVPKLLRPGAIPEVGLFRPVIITPGLDPFAELAKALLARQTLGPELVGGRFAEADALTEALRGDPVTAAGVIGEALDRAAAAQAKAAHFDEPRPARLLLAVDQAERLFAEAPKDADAFGALLQAFAGAAAYVIMVMRADAYARFQACAPLLTLRTAGATFDLLPPTSAELEDIVTGPATRCQPTLKFGESASPLPGRLVSDAKGGDALPLLQMTLEGLYKAQEARDDGILRAEDYKGMEAAVTQAANAAMKPLGENGRKALEALVAGLVTNIAADPVTSEPIPVVRPLDRDAFVKGDPDRAALIKAFVNPDARLLTIDGDGRVRPTHEALLRIWPAAAAMVSEMAVLIRARHALIPLAQAWAESVPADKPKSLEIPVPLLAAGQQLEARFGEDLGAPLRPFIAAAVQRDEEARAHTRAVQEERARAAEALAKARGRVAWAAGIGLIVALGLATAAGWQWREAAAQKAAAERNLALATDAADSLVFDIAQKFRDVSGVPASLVKSVLDRASELQQKLLNGGQSSPYLLRSQAAASLESCDTLLTLGDTKGALVAAQEAASISEGLLQQAPGSTDYQLLVSLADEKIGDVKTALGNLAGALKTFEDSLAIRETLAKADPGNAGWQRDLSVSYDKIGRVKTAQSDFAGALKAYQDSLAIIETLAKEDPGNADWQEDVALTYAHVAWVYLAQKYDTKAREALQACRAIMAKLVALSPDNAGFKKDLAWCDQPELKP
jgi:tetratricopeptide (TPR) repeat protein